VDSSVIAFPRALDGSGDPEDAADEVGMAALVEIDAAIALVAARVARRVRLTALPFVETIGGLALAHARAAGMGFRFERPERAGVVTVTIGPLDSALDT
jgi:hypothetical protein